MSNTDTGTGTGTGTSVGTGTKKRSGPKPGTPSPLKGRKRYWFSTSRAKNPPVGTRFFTVASNAEEAAGLAANHWAAAGGKVYAVDGPGE